MKNIKLSEKELEVIIQSLRERENIMFNQSLIYKNQDNKPAQMDCIEEMHIAQHLRERLQETKNK
jgi:hypothetical protein